jgi:hypothetical protein
MNMPRTFPRIGPTSNKKANPVKEVKIETPESIRKYTTAQLTQRASELGVDLSSFKNNAERADAIIAAIAALGKE